MIILCTAVASIINAYFIVWSSVFIHIQIALQYWSRCGAESGMALHIIHCGVIISNYGHLRYWVLYRLALS